MRPNDRLPPGYLAARPKQRVEAPDGPYVSFYKNGVKAVEGTVLDGLHEGKWTFWYADARKGEEGSYVAGQRTGTWLITDAWHHDRRGTVTYDHGQVNGERRMNYEDGSLWRLHVIENDRAVGRQCEYFPNGQLMHAVEWKDNMMTGLEESHYANGLFRERGRYSKGVKEGEWWWWHTDGTPEVHGCYVAGKTSGVWLYWQPDGNLDLSRSGSVEDGVLRTPVTDAQVEAARMLRISGTQK